ncbi:universal stress protein [soil metagenome]
MAFKDILVTLTAYPDPMPVAAANRAVDFAAVLGAPISAISCGIRIQPPGSILSSVLIDLPGMVTAEVSKSSANAERLLDAFQDRAQTRGVFQERIFEQCLTPDMPRLLTDYARLRDLTIVPVLQGENVHQWDAEAIIFGSGRPTLILPQTPEPYRPFALDTAVVAWDFSRPAARAIADATPVLEMMKQVRVVTVTNEKRIESGRFGADLARHLACHGIEAVMDTVDAAGRGIGDALGAYAASRNADLLVMGAYGHSRVREFVLGGATRSMLARAPLPVFLSH